VTKRTSIINQQIGSSVTDAPPTPLVPANAVRTSAACAGLLIATVGRPAPPGDRPADPDP
jgi:hypothetical protein